MQLTTLLNVLAAAAVARAFVIPEGQAPGTYEVIRRADGTEEHIKIGEAVDSASSAVDTGITLAKRDTEFFWCGCGIQMNHGQCDAAVQGLKNQIGGGTVNIQAYRAWYSNTNSGNDVVAFICNRGSADHTTNAGILTKLLQDITNDCGYYTPGTVLSFDTGLYYGYMNWRQGLDFCSDSTSSNSGKC